MIKVPWNFNIEMHYLIIFVSNWLTLMKWDHEVLTSASDAND